MLRETFATGFASGEITISISWATGREGGRYLTAGVGIEIDSIDVLTFSAVSDGDLAASGEIDRESLRDVAALADPIGDDTFVCRVEFHVV